jgi:hypothetical protein
MEDKYVVSIVQGLLFITGIIVFTISYVSGVLDPFFK